MDWNGYTRTENRDLPQVKSAKLSQRAEIHREVLAMQLLLRGSVRTPTRNCSCRDATKATLTKKWKLHFLPSIRLIEPERPPRQASLCHTETTLTLGVATTNVPTRRNNSSPTMTSRRARRARCPRTCTLIRHSKNPCSPSRWSHHWHESVTRGARSREEWRSPTHSPVSRTPICTTHSNTGQTEQKTGTKASLKTLMSWGVKTKGRGCRRSQ